MDPVMMKLRTLCLLSVLLCASSCDVFENIVKPKSCETIQLHRQQLNADWSRIGSTLFHRNGLLWIEFDSITRVDISPDHRIRVIGTNPVIHGSDMDNISGSSAASQTAKPSDSNNSQSDEPPSPQKIAPLLVLSLLIIIAILWTSSKLKLF